MKRLFLVLAFAARALLTAAAPSPAASLFGRVRGKPRVQPKADSGGAYSSRALRYATLFDYQNLKDVIVYVEAADSSTVIPSALLGGEWTLRLDKYRGGIKITPELLIVPEGASVSFKNAWPKPVTVYSGGDSVRRIRADLEAGESKTMKLSETGLYRMYCLDDPGTSSKLFVAGSTFSVADFEGRYSLNLPAGKYKVTAWHARLPPQTQEIQLLGDKKLELDFTLSAEQLHETH